MNVSRYTDMVSFGSKRGQSFASSSQSFVGWCAFLLPLRPANEYSALLDAYWKSGEHRCPAAVWTACCFCTVVCSDSLINVEQWTVIGIDSDNDDERWRLSLISNASAVTSHFVLNSRHSICILLCFKVYSLDYYIVTAGNGNDSMGVGRECEQESHSRTPLVGGCRVPTSGEGSVEQMSF